MRSAQDRGSMYGAGGTDAEAVVPVGRKGSASVPADLRVADVTSEPIPPAVLLAEHPSASVVLASDVCGTEFDDDGPLAAAHRTRAQRM
jgi:hypothetical protein